MKTFITSLFMVTLLFSKAQSFEIHPNKSHMDTVNMTAPTVKNKARG